MNTNEIRQDLVHIEELEDRAVPGAMFGNQPIIEPTTIVWDIL